MDHPITWAEINLNAYAHNIRELRRVTRPTARLMAVVKANGYGHGSVEVAREALQNGAQYLGVARINEAIPLREAGLDVPILIFGYSPPDLAPALIEYDLTQTVYSLSTASALSEQATRKGKKINVHLKVDSGMGRLGFLLAVPMLLTGSLLPGMAAHAALDLTLLARRPEARGRSARQPLREAS